MLFNISITESTVRFAEALCLKLWLPPCVVGTVSQLGAGSSLESRQGQVLQDRLWTFLLL